MTLRPAPGASGPRSSSMASTANTYQPLAQSVTVQKLPARLEVTTNDFDVVELNDAFASLGLTVLGGIGLAYENPKVNPRCRAIALGYIPYA